MSSIQLLNEARQLVSRGNLQEAIKYYETLEARYPMSLQAQQTQLEIAHAYYQTGEADTALDAIDRFMLTYPAHKNIDYALYLRGLINFNRGSSVLDRVFPRKFADLDEVKQKEAFHDFSKLITRHPNSKYTKDAKIRILHLRNVLAETEVNVAQYYLERKAYLAAFNRAEYTIKHYDGSPAVITALKIKIKAAQLLGKPNIAKASQKVLEHNFPNH